MTGDDVGQDPDAIQREIEQTRAELAQTIDLIAEKVSPKRAASRGAARVKDAFSSPAELEAPADLERTAEPIGGYAGTTTYATTRTLRKDRVALVALVMAAVVALIVWSRRRS